MSFLARPISLLWRHRGLLWQTTRNDVRARYAGSILGLAWLIAYPLVFLGTYALVYIFIFKVRFPGLFDSNEYVVLIFCGLIPFIGFAEALSLGVVAVTSNSNLIKNTLFPIELIPVKAVLTSQCTQIAGIGLLLIAVGAMGRLTWWALMLPAVWLLQLMFTMGVIWILSSLNVIMRDLQAIIGVVILILMMGSPIAYTVEMIPANLRPLLGVNPLYYMIISYQDVLMMGRWPSNEVLWVLLGISVLSFWGGYWFFGRMKKVFVDSV
jgi:lipopolysaccharide transport system permease protein